MKFNIGDKVRFVTNDNFNGQRGTILRNALEARKGYDVVCAVVERQDREHIFKYSELRLDKENSFDIIYNRLKS